MPIPTPTGNDNQTINIPNQETLNAIAETLSGNCIVFDNIEDFFKSLDLEEDENADTNADKR